MSTRKTYSIQRPVKASRNTLPQQEAKPSQAPESVVRYEANTYSPSGFKAAQKAPEANHSTQEREKPEPYRKPANASNSDVVNHAPTSEFDEQDNETTFHDTLETSTSHDSENANDEIPSHNNSSHDTEAEEQEDTVFPAGTQEEGDIIITTGALTDIQPDTWIIAKSDDGKEAVLNFYNNKKVICSFPLSEANAETLIPVLQNFYTPPEIVVEEKLKPTKRFTQWYKKHKVIGTITILIVLVVAVNIVAGFFLNGIY